jgi:hypothetical protein
MPTGVEAPCKLDNFARNHKLGLVFETKAKAGLDH